ncbi:MAG TPA: cobalt-precorrin-5B (C(1))-methyltransferase [Dehalococcoidia bacterium]|nr:cobalt-precorrin-5B (C(1))-methyltransferase [Dehalococcoidia bacterium]
MNIETEPLADGEEDLKPVKRRGLRTGFTTGSCAAAAAKAATLWLVTGQAPAEVTIVLPVGRTATFAVHGAEAGPDGRLCSVIKDAGDDPDVTHLAEIQASVAWTEALGLVLAGGVGVGTVTKPGLGLEVGGPAINPVPRRMIQESVDQALRECGFAGLDRDGLGASSGPGLRRCPAGLRVTISVPNGEELARRTLNGRLGILGGISILGTTGIVQPYSTASWRASVLQAIDVAAANGVEEIVLSTGGRSERFAARLIHLPEIAYVEMGEFTGHALKQAVKRHLRKVYLAGMVGKFSKIAQGHFMTHVAGNQVDPHYLADLAYACGATEDLRDRIRNANTARHFQELILAERGPRSVFDAICAEVCRRSVDLVRGQIAVEALLFDFDGTVLGRAAADGVPT